MSKQEKNAVLSVRDLSVSFHVRNETNTAIRNVSLDLYEDETLAIVGETGSGKTVLTRAFSGLLAKNGTISSGQVLLDGAPLSEKDLHQLSGSAISFVFQEPASALDPVMRVGEQIAAVIRKRERCGRKTARTKAADLMRRVGIRDAESCYDDYPFQFSGGMLQRLVIAVALSCRPRILVCDEATTALDVTVQARVLALLKSLQQEMRFSLVVITHDFGVVAKAADRVAVMYAGEIVEQGLTEEIFYDARHPYTWALLSSLPQLARPDNPLPYLEGLPPSPGKEAEGDLFAPRNAYRMRIDLLKAPPLFPVTESHFARTWLLYPGAPRMEKPEVLRHIRETLRHQMTSSFEKQARETDAQPILAVRGAEIAYGRGRALKKVVDGVELDIHKGEILALAGESGSGKTTLGKTIAGFLPLQRGEILFHGKPISEGRSKAEKRELRKDIQMVFQNPTLALNDRMTAGQILTEGLDNFAVCSTKEERARRIEWILQAVGLLPEHLTRYPHELSGGQRQRLALARALILRPAIVVADEPVASLDVSVRAQVLNLVRQFSREDQTGFLFISHDLSVLRLVADRVAVMEQGRLVELAETEELFCYPMHPYTRELLSAVPIPDPELERERAENDPAPEKRMEPETTLREICPGHYVACPEAELETLKQQRAAGVSTNPLRRMMEKKQEEYKKRDR